MYLLLRLALYLLPLLAVVSIYIQKDAIIEDIKEKALGSITSGLTDALPSIVDGSIPDATGPAIPEVTTPSF